VLLSGVTEPVLISSPSKKEKALATEIAGAVKKVLKYINYKRIKIWSCSFCLLCQHAWFYLVSR
jgi:hypothetical protein